MYKAYKSIFPKSALLALLIALVLSISVGSFLPRVKGRIGTQPGHPLRTEHKLYHLLTFGSTAFVAMLLVRTRRSELGAALSVFTWGFVIEAIQYAGAFSAVMEWWDVRDDFYGSAGAFALIQAANLLDKRAHNATQPVA